jgi:hypothetical protein
MQRFEFYLRDGDDMPDEEAVADILAGLGCILQGGAGYRPGTWNDAATGARAVLDLGTPPIEEDVQHPPRAYAGWAPLRLAVQLPLVCPHWQAVEGFQLIERLLAAVPGVHALDCEDIQEHKDAEAAPFAWSRPRALASWERQHAAQIETRTDLARMGRGDSLRLWRWRREREAAWPAATVLRDRSAAEAHAVCVWPDPAAPCVLPTIGLVLVRLDQPRLVRRCDLPAGEPRQRAGGMLVAPPGTWPDGIPTSRFAACDDEMWID